MTFAERLRELRIKQSISQQKLADLINVSQAAVYQWEKGSRIPKIEQVRKIAHVLGVTISDLVDDWSMYSSKEYANDWENQREEFEDVEKMIQSYLRGEHEMNSFERELKILEYFRKLNIDGEYKALEQVELLTKIPEYQRQEEHDFLAAAHKNNPTPEQKAAADQIMEDDSEWE